MRGRLFLSTAFDGEKTVTDDLYFSPPFKMYSPFYENGRAKYISMCAAAGVLAGDENKIDLDIGADSSVIFTDQGYQKLFNTDGSISRQDLEISVEERAELIYMPHPVMTFAGCDHEAKSTIKITDSSHLVFSEIYCCGRTAMGESFGLKRFRSRTEISVNGRADFIDNTLIEPSRLPIESKGFFEGFTHTGFMYLYSPKIDRIKFTAENAYNDDSVQLCCSKTEKGLSIRALGYSGEEIYELFLKISKMFSE